MGSKATRSQQRGQGRNGTNPSGERNQTGERTADNTGKNDEVLGGTSERVTEEKQNPQEENTPTSLLDVIKVLYTKGKDFASQLFQRSFFNVAQTPKFMQELGLRGNKFTIKYRVIARHFGKDGSYWNVNSGGVFRKGYTTKKRKR